MRQAFLSEKLTIACKNCLKQVVCFFVLVLSIPTSDFNSNKKSKQVVAN